MGTITFLGLDCIPLKNNSLELLVTQSVGPRIIRLSLLGAENLLAELPDVMLDCPGTGKMNLWGGHRLWHAPEVKRRTYLPDNQPVTITEIENGLEVVQPTEVQTGIQKSMHITLPDQSATVIIDHTLKNEGIWPVELAPWAITQLKLGGFVVLPQITDIADPDGLQPNRRLTLWPYTDMNSSHIQWGNRYIVVHASVREGALKLGFPNPAGWLAYYLNQTLFVKQATYQAEAEYLDFGSSSECYCNADFLELETLGPQTILEPGQAVSHRETWRLYADVQLEPTEDAIQQIVEALSL